MNSEKIRELTRTTIAKIASNQDQNAHGRSVTPEDLL
jgi:hypothetical protein